MPAQMIDINDHPFALLPKAEYQELLAKAAGVDLPELPKPNKRGNFSKDAILVTMARDLITQRLAAGLSQEQLAKRAKVAVETISRLEGGKHKPQAATVAKLEAALAK